MASPNPRIDSIKAQQAAHRKRSSSLEHLRGILRDCERFLPGTPERLSSLENMHSLLAAENKKMRSVAHGSPATSGEALERFFTEAEGGVGSLGLSGGGYSEFHMDDGVAFMDYTADDVKPDQEEDPMVTSEPVSAGNSTGPPLIGGGLGNVMNAPSISMTTNANLHSHSSGVGGLGAGALSASSVVGGGAISGIGGGGVIGGSGLHHHHHHHHVHHAAPVGLPPRPHTAASEQTTEQQAMPERRLSHKEVEQRRREKAKQYFDELRSLLPSAQDSKFDKNSILQNSIQLIKSLRAELTAASLGRGPAETSALSLEYRSVFNLSRHCMAFAGLDGRIWEANTAFSILLGHTPEETTSLTILSVTAREDSELSLQQGRRLLAREIGPSCSYSVRLVKKDSSYLHCNVELTLLERDSMPYCFLFAAHAIG